MAFRVVAPRAPEGPDALENARAKAREVAARSGIPPGGAVLGADTEVLADGEALGKPAGRDEAGAMLRRLSGREHVVETAVVLLAEGGAREARERARVTFRPLSDEQVEWLLDAGEWRDRAGGYAIQGRAAAVIAGVSGDVTAVVGLPLGAVAAALAELGLAPWGRRG